MKSNIFISLFFALFLLTSCATVQTKVDEKTKEEQERLSVYIGKNIEEVFNTLKLKPKVRRIMWSRRAQEYDAKIHSGSPIKIAEVIRDLFRKNSQPEQSYSERQMFQIALERLAREVGAVEKTDYFQATEKIENTLYKK